MPPHRSYPVRSPVRSPVLGTVTPLTSLLLLLSFSIFFIPHPYISTDFYVHRNWLAITHNKKIEDWYIDETDNVNTPDYPPMFMGFEWVLGKIFDLVPSSLVSSNCVSVLSFPDALDQTTQSCITFHRLSTLTVYFFLYVPTIFYISPSSSPAPHLILNFGLLFLDLIHFQYNTLIYTFYLLSLHSLQKKKWSASCVAFCILLNLKHLYVYIAPIFLLHILSSHVFLPHPSLPKFLKIASVTLSFLLPPWLPFLPSLPKIFTRLFPFHRGLIHSYWSPNLWSLYIFLDRILFHLSKPLNLQPKITKGGTSGLVTSDLFTILPPIPASLCMLLILLLSTPILIKLYKRKIKPIPCAILLMYNVYMLGYHIHEKSIINVLILLPFIDIEGGLEKVFVGNGWASLAPIWGGGNRGVKVLTFFMGWRFYGREGGGRGKYYFIEGFIVFYVLAAEGIEVVGWAGEGTRLEFLPTMIYSVCGAVVNFCLWGDLWRACMEEQTSVTIKKDD
ncbi:hypothetical protein TrVE_jg7910 [Triparma verrucosa]|uniref:Alpha-1,3-glucosyltransferase n=1 Tax=Triparma verrucosa TaxID=1606542 RepID=A0A9W7BVU5_9STRA|nr:hypothetical protein TrVE_jg7910 [Triparma verrucosa]